MPFRNNSYLYFPVHPLTIASDHPVLPNDSANPSPADTKVNAENMQIH